MTSDIGKALVFYNLYFHEMERLSDDKKAFSQINQRSDRKRILKMVAEVKRSAGREARGLLEACMMELKSRIEGAKVAKIVKATRNRTSENAWEVTFHVQRLRQKKHDSRTPQIGMTLLPTEGLTTWVWSPGGIADESRIAGLFSRETTRFYSRKGDWLAGTVHLAPIPVRWNSHKAFSLNRAPVLAKAELTLKAISVNFIEKLLAER